MPYPVAYIRYLSTAGCARVRGEQEIYGWIIRSDTQIIVVSRMIVKGKYRQAITIPKTNIKELRYV